jgi:hypothetical protein
MVARKHRYSQSPPASPPVVPARSGFRDVVDGIFVRLAPLAVSPWGAVIYAALVLLAAGIELRFTRGGRL